MRVLLAEDEGELANWLIRAMAQTGFVVDWTNDGRMVLPSLAKTRYDALILDLGLPGRGGHEILAELRRTGVGVPVLVLTARDSLAERVSTLHEGADDFLSKPFEIAELEARLVALIRRARGQDHPRFTCGPLHYDSATRQFTMAGEPLALSPREHAVLRALLPRSGEPLSKLELFERVFSDDRDVNPEVIEVLVHRLRKRLEGSAVRVVTLRGLGYLLEAM